MKPVRYIGVSAHGKIIEDHIREARVSERAMEEVEPEEKIGQGDKAFECCEKESREGQRQTGRTTLSESGR